MAIDPTDVFQSTWSYPATNRVLIEGPVDPHERRVAEVIAGAVRGVVSVRVRG